MESARIGAARVRPGRVGAVAAAGGAPVAAGGEQLEAAFTATGLADRLDWGKGA